MREIMEVSKYIRKELKRAEEYAYEANKHKHEYPDMAAQYYRAAHEHLEIVDDLHLGVIKLIEAAKRGGAVPTEAMRKMWDFEHDMLIEEKADIVRLLDMYKG